MHHITDQMNTSHHTHHHNRIHEHTHSPQREEAKRPSVSQVAQQAFSSKEHARPFISPTQRHIQQKLLTQGLSSTAILFICENEEKSLNGCNIATAIHRMAKNFQHDGRYLSEPEQEYITSLCSSKREEFKSQEVANILWAFATLGIQKEALFDELTTRALQISGSFNSQEIANILGTFATLGINNEALFNKLAERALQISGSFNSQDVSNTLWAFATLDIQNEALFNKLAERALQISGSFNSQAISNTLWAFAKLGINDKALFNKLAKERSKSLDRSILKPLPILYGPLLLWAFITKLFLTNWLKERSKSLDRSILKTFPILFVPLLN